MVRSLTRRFKKVKLELVFCHRQPDRTPSIYLFGKSRRLLCYRCCGAVLGSFLPWVLLFKSNLFRHLIFVTPLTGIAISLLLSLPMALDGFGQAFGYWKSTNPRRLFTGLGGGASPTILAMIVAGLLLRFI